MPRGETDGEAPRAATPRDGTGTEPTLRHGALEHGALEEPLPWLGSRYSIERELGRGGMGRVFAARDLNLGRQVAIKVLAPGSHGEEVLRRFEQEARAAGSLDHPNVLVVHDIGNWEGGPFIVSELLQGATLRDRLAPKAIPPAKAVDYALQLAQGLRAAHEKGIIHRDLKPENLFITREGRLKILDFGIAKLAAPAGTAPGTGEGAILGTVGYMSPEQVRGQRADQRSDIFACGSILYEMLAGRPAFEGATHLETAAAILNDEPAPLPAQVPPGLERIVRRCLEKDAADRFQSAADFAVALATMPPAAARRTFPRKGAAVVAGVLLVAGTLVAIAIRGGESFRARSPGPVAPAIQSIAVLPLQNLSGDEKQEYFSNGMTEALTTNLARMERLQVISRTSAMLYKSANKPLPEIARELKADAIVEGSVERSGNRVRITAQLIHAATDKHLWAQTYERDFRDILQLENDVASAIAQQIQTRLGGPRPSASSKAVTVNSEAYETFLQANYLLDSGQVRKSIDYYNQAVKLDPNYGPTYAHMARAYFFLTFFGYLSPREGWGDVKRTATLSLEKDETIPEAHGALALAKLHYDWDFAGAEREFQRSLELNPNDADIRHDYAHHLMAMGRVGESQAESRRAVQLDPLGSDLGGCLCWHSFAARQYEEADRLARQFLAANPDDPWEHVILGWTDEQTGKPEQAIAEFQKALAIQDSPLFQGALGHAYAVSGRRNDAERVLRTLSERARTSYVSPFDIALIYAGLGEKDAAFSWLDKALADRSTWLVYSKWEPRLDGLRSDPRFQALLQRVGLPL